MLDNCSPSMNRLKKLLKGVAATLYLFLIEFQDLPIEEYFVKSDNFSRYLNYLQKLFIEKCLSGAQ